MAEFAIQHVSSTCRSLRAYKTMQKMGQSELGSQTAVKALVGSLNARQMLNSPERWDKVRFLCACMALPHQYETYAGSGKRLHA